MRRKIYIVGLWALGAWTALTLGSGLWLTVSIMRDQIGQRTFKAVGAWLPSGETSSQFLLMWDDPDSRRSFIESFLASFWSMRLEQWAIVFAAGATVLLLLRILPGRSRV